MSLVHIKNVNISLYRLRVAGVILNPFPIGQCTLMYRNSKQSSPSRLDLHIITAPFTLLSSGTKEIWLKSLRSGNSMLVNSYTSCTSIESDICGGLRGGAGRKEIDGAIEQF
jgi:hypothetical protein